MFRGLDRWGTTRSCLESTTRKEGEVRNQIRRRKEWCLFAQTSPKVRRCSMHAETMHYSYLSAYYYGGTHPRLLWWCANVLGKGGAPICNCNVNKVCKMVHAWRTVSILCLHHLCMLRVYSIQCLNSFFTAVLLIAILPRVSLLILHFPLLFQWKP